MSEKPGTDLEKIWKRIGVLLLILTIVIVAGPQIIDLIDPDFR